MHVDRFTSSRPSQVTVKEFVGRTLLAGSLLFTACTPSSTGNENPAPVVAKAPTFGPALPSASKEPVAPTPKDILSTREKDQIVKDLLDTANYSADKLDQLESWAKKGTSTPTMFVLPNGSGLYVNFAPLSESTSSDLSGVNIAALTNEAEGKRVFQFQFGVYTAERINNNFPPEIKEALTRRETAVINATVIGFTSFFNSKGIDLTQPIGPQLTAAGLTDAQMSSLLDQVHVLISPYVDAVSRFEEAAGILPQIDRNPKNPNTLLFATLFADTPNQRPQQVSGRLPLIRGKVYEDRGKVFNTINAFGSNTLDEFPGIETLQRKYSSLNLVPGWQPFFNQIKGN